MTLEPLLAAPVLIQIHAFAALAAFALGIFQLTAPKGTVRHRTTGWIWVGLMTTVVVTSFGIHDMRTWGAWSPIHLLSIFTAVMLPVGILHARRHRVKQHRATMIWIFVGALIVAGIFTLLPGRIMHDVVFGSTSPSNRKTNSSTPQASALRLRPHPSVGWCDILRLPMPAVSPHRARRIQRSHRTR